jgi:ribosomal protein S18 acetylase RimI-like enzyme
MTSWTGRDPDPAAPEPCTGHALITGARLADLPQIVRLHGAAFPRHFLTQLGEAFLAQYYRFVLEHGCGVLLAAKLDGRNIAGFVSGFLDPPAFYSRMRKKRWALAATLIRPLVQNPRLLRWLLHDRRRVIGTAHAAKGQQHVAELSSLAVHPHLEGRGLGSRLVEHFTARAKQMGAHSVYLLTDAQHNERVSRFYERLGFSCQPVPGCLPQRPMNKYTKLLR